MRVGIGIAAREGTTLDLSTVESTRQVLIDAGSIVLSDGATGGLSRPNATQVIANLGLTDALADKIQYARGGQRLVGSGEAEIGLYNLGEIPRAEGVVRAGPVPEEVQVYINYDAAIPAGNDAPEPALALVEFLSRPETRATWENAGLRLAED